MCLFNCAYLVAESNDSLERLNKAINHVGMTSNHL